MIFPIIVRDFQIYLASVNLEYNNFEVAQNGPTKHAFLIGQTRPQTLNIQTHPPLQEGFRVEGSQTHQKHLLVQNS
jgi:hypothetical protein